MLVSELIERLQELPATASVFVQMLTPPVAPGAKDEKDGDIRDVRYQHGNVEIVIGMFNGLLDDDE